MLKKKAIGAFVAAATLLSGFAFASLAPVAFANDGTGDTNQTEHNDNDVIKFADKEFESRAKQSMDNYDLRNHNTDHNYSRNGIEIKQAREYNGFLRLGLFAFQIMNITPSGGSIAGSFPSSVSKLDDLKYFPNVTDVSLSGNEVSDFSPLSSLSHLDTLSLNINTSKVPNAKLPYIKNLRKLELSSNDRIFFKEGYTLTNLAAISKLTDLKELEVSSNDLTSLSGVESLSNLEKLTINCSDNLTDLTPLGRLTNLKELNINGVSVKDISFLKNLIKLEKLKIYNTHNSGVKLSIPNTLANLKELSIYTAEITNLDVLSQFTNLEKLSINVTDKTTDLSFVKNLKKLKELGIDGSNISDISALDGVSNNLTSVDIWSGKLSNLKSFAKLTNLKELTVGSEVSDISGIESLSKLEKLSISGSYSCDKKLSDLKPLENLTNLTELDISQASVPNVSVFNNLTKLTKLSLNESYGEIDISDLKINNLTYLSLRCSKVKSLSPIEAYKGKGMLLELDKSFDSNTINELKKNTQKLSVIAELPCSSVSCINRSNVPNLPGYVPGHVPGHGSGSVPGTGSINNGSVNPDWNLFDPDEPDDFADLLGSLNSDGSGDSVSNTVSDSSTSALDSLTPALDDNIDFSEMLDMADFDVDMLGDLSDFGNMNVGDFTGTDSADNSGDAGIPSGVDDFNIDDFDLSDFDFADLLDYLGDLDLDDLAPADVADADSSAPAVPVGVGVVIR